MGHVLVDTGPIIALLNRGDDYHAWARQELADLSTPLVTCESVVSEACFLLRQRAGGLAAVMELLHRGIMRVTFRLDDELAAVARLLVKYADVPMSLADACLVRMAEQTERSVVLTMDSDFTRYRMHGRHAIALRTPGTGGLR